MAVYAPAQALVANTDVVGSQFLSDIAPLTGGGYVVSWSSQASSGTASARARVYGADGLPKSEEVTVGAASYNAVTALADGGFAVWFGDVRTEGASAASLRLFDASGIARSGPIVLDTEFDANLANVGRLPLVTALADGRVAFVWTESSAEGSGLRSSSTVGQILNPDGSAATGRLQLGPVRGDRFGPGDGFGLVDLDVTALANGGFALLQASFRFGGAPSLDVGKAEAQFFGPDGEAITGVIDVRPPGLGITGVSATTLPDGRVVVGTISGFRTIAPDGTLGTGHFPTSDGPGANLARGPVEVAALPDGNLLLTYTETGKTVAGVYTPDGAKIGLSIKDAAYGLGGSALATGLSQDAFVVAGTLFPGVDQSDVATRVIRSVAPTDDPDGSALVNDAFYLARNADVAAAGQDPDQHYHVNGWREGRDPNALFDSDAYRFANADVRTAAIDPLEQYHLYGWKEGRDPSAAFDTQIYLNRNADVRAAGIDPFEHYLQAGRAEGREAFAAIGQASIANGAFDAAYYLLANRDVARSGIDAYQHYLANGLREGRDSSAYFDTTGYLDAYADVRAAGIDPLAHYDQYGWKEGRDPSGLFDTVNYLTANADVAASGMDPLTHYLRYGSAEGRSPLGDGIFG